MQRLLWGGEEEIAVRTRVPDYYESFQCWAGACPHSCCIGWEVVVDEDTALRYAQETGPLGERLRAALRRDEEGDLCFPLRGGRCPFLDGENLCEIHRELGEAATSATCREHPRFTEEYGPFREISLAASCPAANALLLGSREPLTFQEWETPEAAETGDPWLEPLLAVRTRMLALLEDRTRPLRRRLNAILALAQAAQPLLDRDRGELLPNLAAEWRPAVESVPPGPGLFPAAQRFLAELECLEPDWRALLHQSEAAAPVPTDEAPLERIAAYFLFRQILKTVNDGDLLSRTSLCVFAVLTVERISAICGLPEALRRFSREVEHDSDNLEDLRAFLWEGGVLDRIRRELAQ